MYSPGWTWTHDLFASQVLRWLNCATALGFLDSIYLTKACAMDFYHESVNGEAKLIEWSIKVVCELCGSHTNHLNSGN